MPDRKLPNLITLPLPARESGPDPIPPTPAQQIQDKRNRVERRYRNREAMVLRADTADRIAAIRGLFLTPEQRWQCTRMENELREAIREQIAEGWAA